MACSEELVHAFASLSVTPAEVVQLTWEWLIPQLPFMFRVQSSDADYRLFQEVVAHIELEYPLSAINCDLLSANNRSLSDYHPCIGRLVTRLADRYTVPDGRVQIAFEASPEAALDFIIIGMFHVVGVNRNSGNQHSRYHETCSLRKENPDLEGWPIYQTAFLDLMATLWEQECRTRNFAVWSPMPWSQISMRERVIISDRDPPTIPDILLQEQYEEDTITRMMRSNHGCPLNIPWLNAPHDGYPVGYNLSTYTKIRRAVLPSLQDDAALWLGAMTMGLLESVAQVKIPEIVFVIRSDGEEGTFLHGRRILHFLCAWHVHMQAKTWPNENERLETGRNVASLLYRALGSLDQECRHGMSLLARAGLSEDEVVNTVGAVAVTVNVIYGHATSIWMDLPEMQALKKEFQDVRRNSYNAAVEACSNNMRRAGWCPNLIQTQLNAISGLLSAISNMTTLQPFIRHSRDEHKNCTNWSCVFYNISDTTAYRPLHVDSSCDCEYLKPSLDDVTRILSTDDEHSIPCVVFDGQSLSVRPASEGQFIAISHVWADGMGSTSEEGLPRCLVERLASLVERLSPQYGAFWIDSLCVPANPSLRKCAIKRMANTYADAEKVLVIDKCIRKSCALSQPWDKNLFGIAISGWMRRVWTLQEGILARELYFEFSDGIVNLEQERDRVQAEHNDSSRPDWLTSQHLLNSMEILNPSFHLPYAPLLTYRAEKKGAHGQYTLHEVIRLLQMRSTTKAEDEMIAISSLLPLNVGDLLAITGPDAAERRMKAALVQLRDIPKQLVFVYVPKLTIPGFGWAPRSLAETYARTKQEDDEAVCTEDGLFAEYYLATFAETGSTPDHEGGSSEDTMDGHPVFELLISHRPSQSTYRARLVLPAQPLSFDALIMSVPEFSPDRQVSCALVLGGAGKGKGKEGADEDSRKTVPLRCRFVTSGYVSRLAWAPEELEQNKVNRPLLLEEVRRMLIHLI